MEIEVVQWTIFTVVDVIKKNRFAVLKFPARSGFYYPFYQHSKIGYP